jgi:N-acetylmuramoyl-L-alanine amidase
MGEIIIANQPFQIAAPVKNWRTSGWDATVEACIRPTHPCKDGVTPYGTGTINTGKRRYAFRPRLRKYGKNPPLEAVKAVIKQFIFHHDGCADAAMCWEVLHNERGLSCHFIVDNDGTIYQTIDLAYMAYHAAEYNISSIGVEMSNRGAAKSKDDPYYHHKRAITSCTINNSKILCFDFTEAQKKSMRQLCSDLTHFLPNLPIEYPQSAPGQQSTDTLGDAFSYAGYLGHYHCTRRKWDPGPFNFKEFCEKLRGQRSFPVWAKKGDQPPTERPLVPTNGSELKEQLDFLYELNEERAGVGFFPVGPWGEYRLWHGGVHLAGKDQQAVYSPFAGRIVAARMGKGSPIGSVNFVLVRHDMTIGTSNMRFFSLYMHLNDEAKEKDEAARPGWLAHDYQDAKDRSPDEPGDGAAPPAAPAAQSTAPKKKKIWEVLANEKKGQVVLLDEPVEAGQLIGRIGRAGPDNRAQLHFEIFADSDVLEKYTDSRLDLKDGSGSGRFCEFKEINDPIDTSPKDGLLSRRELVTYFASPGGRDLDRLYVTLNVSEWIAEPNWGDSLRSVSDFRTMKPAEIDELIAEQITPGLWWTEEVSKHAPLPADGIVYHFHPINFVGFINQKIQEAALLAPPPPKPGDLTGAGGVPKGVTDDYGDVTGASAITIAQRDDRDPYEDLGLEQMVQGYEGAPQ